MLGGAAAPQGPPLGTCTHTHTVSLCLLHLSHSLSFSRSCLHPIDNAFYCQGGIASGSTCCAKSCGKCGGNGCGQLPGGSSGCCRGAIKRSGTVCAAATDTQCIIPGMVSSLRRPVSHGLSLSFSLSFSLSLSLSLSGWAQLPAYARTNTRHFSPHRCMDCME